MNGPVTTVLRKNISLEKDEKKIFDDARYFFFVTDKRELPIEDVVFGANKRCNQENLIEQLNNGVGALRMPIDDLVSNWAHTVMASPGWSIKAWCVLSLPETGRRLIYRLLSWNPYQHILLRLAEGLEIRLCSWRGGNEAGIRASRFAEALFGIIGVAGTTVGQVFSSMQNSLQNKQLGRSSTPQ